MSSDFRISRGEQHLVKPEGKGARQRGFKPRERAADYNPRDHKRFTLNIPTPDDFCPTLVDGTVEVSVMLTTMAWGEPSIRTCVWGGDDMGFERDEVFPTDQEAEGAYQRRVQETQGWGIVTIAMLKELGFQIA